MIDRHLLSLMRETERAGSLTAAAERMNLTQSALSHTLRKFEERAGVTLWIREGRKLRPTQAGAYLLELAGRLLPQIEHAETVLADFGAGRRGTLRLGMECHPCQQWLNRLVAPYLNQWPDVDLDVRTAFRFGGIAALQAHEIDIVITPDALDVDSVIFLPVFDYELVLAVASSHRLAMQTQVEPRDLMDEVLITYPVARERLDVFTRFLVPGHCQPRRHKTVETTEIMLRMVENGRGVSAIPDWLLREEGRDLAISGLRFGAQGIAKSIHIGVRLGDENIDYLQAFIRTARATGVISGVGTQGS